MVQSTLQPYFLPGIAMHFFLILFLSIPANAQLEIFDARDFGMASSTVGSEPLNSISKNPSIQTKGKKHFISIHVINNYSINELSPISLKSQHKLGENNCLLAGLGKMGGKNFSHLLGLASSFPFSFNIEAANAQLLVCFGVPLIKICLCSLINCNTLNAPHELCLFVSSCEQLKLWKPCFFLLCQTATRTLLGLKFGKLGAPFDSTG